MAWYDLLGGLSSGLASGLGQVQQNVEANRRSSQVDREVALRALQEKRAQEEAERAAAMAQYGAAEEGVEFDPSDPSVQAMIRAAGPAAFTKGPSGSKLMKRPSPQRQLTELQLSEAQANLPIAAESRTTQLANIKARQAVEQALTSKYGPDWRANIMDLPPNARQVAGALVYEKPDLFQKPGEHPSVLSAHATGQGMAAYQAARIEDMKVDNAMNLDTQWQRFMDGDIGKMMILTQFGGDVEKARQAWLAAKQQTGTAAPTLQIGKYTVSQ